MSIIIKKLNLLRKQLQCLQSELDLIHEVLEEWHFKFDEYHKAYCLERNINLELLGKSHTKIIKTNLPKVTKEKTGTVKYGKGEKSLKKIYKQLAKKLHPDVGGDEESFKEVTEALQNKNLEKLLDICEKHVILVNVDHDMLNVIRRQISETKQKIKEEKSTYSWNLYLCEGDKRCMDNVIKMFLKHLFRYEEKNED